MENCDSPSRSHLTVKPHKTVRWSIDTLTHWLAVLWIKLCWSHHFPSGPRKSIFETQVAKRDHWPPVRHFIPTCLGVWVRKKVLTVFRLQMLNWSAPITAGLSDQLYIAQGTGGAAGWRPPTSVVADGPYPWCHWRKPYFWPRCSFNCNLSDFSQGDQKVC